MVNDKPILPGLVKFDQYCWLGFIVWFGLELIAQVVGLDSSGKSVYWGIILLLVVYLVRLVYVAEHFRYEQKPRYRLLAYLLVGILGLSVVVQLLR